MQSMHVATIVNTEYTVMAEPIFWVGCNTLVIYYKDMTVGINVDLVL